MTPTSRKTGKERRKNKNKWRKERKGKILKNTRKDKRKGEQEEGESKKKGGEN